MNGDKLYTQKDMHYSNREVEKYCVAVAFSLIMSSIIPVLFISFVTMKTTWLSNRDTQLQCLVFFLMVVLLSRFPLGVDEESSFSCLIAIMNLPCAHVDTYMYQYMSTVAS